MKKFLLIFLILVIGHATFGQITTNPRIKISPNGHYLQTEEGQPFFWLGDTGWEMFNRLNRDEIIRYLDNRKQKGFNVIQAVILDDNASPIGPNRNGDKPLIDNDPARPNENYFKMIDWAIQQAAQRKLYVGLVPTWGSNVSKLRSNVNVLFNSQNAYQYGLFLGKRYASYTNILWVIGGDTPAKSDTADWRPIWRSMAKGIREGAGDKILITYHPSGEASSTDYWRDDNTIDFNMIQSGHRVADLNVWDWVRRDYNLTPAKPILDAEPNYEEHPINWQSNAGRFNDYDVRKQLYRSVFSGACGVTYGHHAIFQFYSERERPLSFPNMYWTQALDAPGAYQSGYIKQLILSRPSLNRVPDQSLIKSGQGQKGEYMTAFRDGDGSYAMIYLPVGKTVEINTSSLKAKNLNAWWFNPKTAKTTRIGTIKNNSGAITFTPPSTGFGNDWVLVLDDAQRKYKPDF